MSPTDLEQLAEDAFNEGWRSREARLGPILNSRSEMRKKWVESNARDALVEHLNATVKAEESSQQPRLLERLQHAPTVFGLINRCCFVTEDSRHALVVDTAKLMAEIRALAEPIAAPAEARAVYPEGEA